MNPTKPLFRKLYLFLLFCVFFLMMIGATVRHYGAGMSCPDWPLCFGSLIPDFHPQVYLEFGHRAFAGLISILMILLNMSLWLHKKTTKTQKVLCVLSFVVLLTQIIFGGLTVLWNLKAGIVASHLAMATVLFGLLSYLYFSLTPVAPSQKVKPAQRSTLKWLTGSMLVILLLQIILGGTVASNNASMVCPDWPLCHGELIPTLSGPIGLQVMHRLLAYGIFVLSLVFLFVAKKIKAPAGVQKMSKMFLIFVCVQIFLGVTNVFAGIPVSIAVLHLAVATKLVYILVKTNYLIRA